MKCLQILFFVCALCVLAAAENKDDPKANRHSQEKSRQYKHGKDKDHIVDRHKKTETRAQSNSYFRHYDVRYGNRQCRVVCNDTTQSNVKNIQIFYNGDASLIAYLNQSASIAVIQDYSSNITALLNGKSVTAIIEDIAKNKYYSIEKSPQTEETLWISSKSDFATFFKSLTSLKKLLKAGEEHGKPINREDLVKAKEPYLVLLDSKESFALNINFINELNSTLAFIFKGQGNFTIDKNIIWFVNVSLAFADIFRDSHTELQSLNITLNLTRIYGFGSGVEALINLLTQLGTRVNLAKILRDQLSSPEKLLELLGELSGGSNEGIDGIITVVITVIRAINARASINDVINAILNYKPDGDYSSLTKVVEEALDLIESQNRVYNNAQAFQSITTVLKAINNRNLVYRNINISDILTLLLSRNPVTMMEVIIRIFTRFSGNEGFPQIIREFIQGLNTSSGLNIITRLFPRSNLENIRHCIETALSNIPIIGSIFRNPFNITAALNASSSVVNSIPVIGPIIANASSGFVSGIENAIGNVVGPFIGSGNSGHPSTPAAPGGGNNTESPNAPTKVPDTGNDKPNCTKNNGNNGTKPTGPPEGTTPTKPSGGSEKTEHPKHDSETTTVSSASTGKPGAPTKEDPKKGNVHEFHGNKDRHHPHQHASDRKENIHTRHKLHEKNHHEHFEAANRKENLHQKHNLHEKDHQQHLKDSNRFHQKHNLLEKDQHGHLHGSNRRENVHYTHRSHQKEAQEKIHNHEKKYENNHNHH